MKSIFLIFIIVILAATAMAAEKYGPYRVEILRVVDGDTVEVAVRVWPGDVRTVLLRLEGVDTPEARSKSSCERKMAAKATEFTRSLVNRSKVAYVRDIQLGKYAGRVLGRLIVGRQDVAKALIKAGLARHYEGGKRKPWC